MSRRWRIEIYGFEWHERVAPTAAAAKYLDFKAAREAGYFQGRDGFHAFLTQLSSVQEVRR